LLPRLPFTRAEVEAIRQPGDVVLLGERAREDLLLEQLGSDTHWRAIHLACHGRLDPHNPTLSSVALTPTAKNDGRLTALQVFPLNIRSDLVALSACDSGGGGIYRGEGLVGLSTAFLAAGARHVLASLWKADDEATQVLMKHFYGAWRGGKTSAAAALRAAQQSVRDQERWRHPRFWAGWVLWGGAR